ncbi:pyridine nucleotide-disulfide oxidoreductase family protein, partial [Mycobacterium avium subsp. avium 2285 (R)]
GPELMDQMREQALRFGADLRMEDVESVSLAGPVKSVTTARVRRCGRAVILAMGAAARYLGVPGEQDLLGRGVSSCATCDGFFFKDQDIAVIGGGDSAMEEATFLTRFARSVTLVHRREEFRASRIMLERARANDKITIVTNKAVEAVEGSETVTVCGCVTRSPRDVDVGGHRVFVAIGHDPRSELVRDVLDTDPDGYVLVQGRTTATSIPGCSPPGPGGPHLPSGRHRRRQRLRGGHRRRTLARRTRRVQRPRKAMPPNSRQYRHIDWSTAMTDAEKASATIEVSDASFSTDVLASNKPVLVDFGRHGVVLARWLRRCSRKSPASAAITSPSPSSTSTPTRKPPKTSRWSPFHPDPVQGRPAREADRRRQGQGGAAA